jgi:hypothetical protein
MPSAATGVKALKPNLFDNGNKFIEVFPHTVSINVDHKRISIFHGAIVNGEPEHTGLEILSSSLKKIYIPMENAYYHLMVDSFSSIANQARLNPGAVFLIPREVFDWSSTIIDKFFVGLKRMHNVSYALLDPGQYQVTNMVMGTAKNLSIASGMYSHDVYLAFSDETSLSLSPHRRIYVSRRAISDDTIDVIDYRARNANHRISDESLLEDFFLGLGFEVVYAETLTIEEKIRLFAETEVLASVTSAGLANAMFMKPGTMMIELLVPIIWPSRVEMYTSLYNKVAAFKSMTYFSVSSIDNSGQEILAQLLNYRNLISQSGVNK